MGFRDIIGATAVEVCDILIKTINNLCLVIHNYQGQAYDGAANVSHYAGHNLDLVLNDVAKEIRQYCHCTQ